MKKKQLDIMLQNDFNFQLNHSLVLCFILLNRNIIPYYNQAFINISSKHQENGFVNLDFLVNDFYDKVLDRKDKIEMRKAKRIDNILNYIREKIDLGEYMIVGVDEYFLSNKERYQEYHYAHQTLIYGYDDDKEIIHGIGFDKEHLFSKLEYKYIEFQKAYLEVSNSHTSTAPWLEEAEILSYKNRIFDQMCPYDTEAVAKEIYNYLNSFSQKNSSEKQGIDVIDDLIETLYFLMEGKEVFEYKNLHMLTEHKKSIYNRLGYFVQQTSGINELANLQKEYIKVLMMVDKMRISFFQKTVDINGPNKRYMPPLMYGKDIGEKKEIFAKLPKDKKYISELIQQVQDVKKVEYEILSKVYECMRNY